MYVNSTYVDPMGSGIPLFFSHVLLLDKSYKDPGVSYKNSGVPGSNPFSEDGMFGPSILLYREGSGSLGIYIYVHKFKVFPSTRRVLFGHTMEPMPSFHPMITVMVSSSCVTFF